MVTFKNIEISTWDYEHPAISWEFEESTLPGGLAISVYRSRSPEPFGQYEEIDTGISPTAYSYTDNTLEGLNQRQYSPWYYILEASDGARSDPHNTEEFDMDLQAKLMLSDKRIGLKHYGKDIKILKKRFSGIECPDCWDDTLQRSQDPNCSTCHGTGKVDGYYDPIEVKAAFRENPKRNEITPFGIWQDGNAQISLLNYPVLAPDDLVIEKNGRRWKVLQIRPYRKKSALISQDALIALQDRESGAYEVL